MSIKDTTQQCPWCRQHSAVYNEVLRRWECVRPPCTWRDR